MYIYLGFATALQSVSLSQQLGPLIFLKHTLRSPSTNYLAQWDKSSPWLSRSI